jgi:acetyltransferase-like isoleucine patch superfamily enzyme
MKSLFKNLIKKALFSNKLPNFFSKILFIRNYLLNDIKCRKNNKLVIVKSILNDCTIKIVGLNNELFIDEFCSLSGMSILINGNNNKVKIGKRVIINASKIQPTIICASGGKTILIGDDCLFSNNIEIHTSDYHKIFNLDGEVINSPDDVVIGKHVWVGLGCTILKGTTISDNCIVGAQTLLNRSYEEKNVILAGSPAQVKRKNTNWDY